MAKLCIYLPPFASDYTGVCSALFDMNCLIAINDANCCTAHYVYWDEPRWEENVRPVFSTQLRTVDAILGNDEKVIDAVSQMAEGLPISQIALVGTPVPAITGMDMEGIACEIEDRTGICTFGFSTTGFGYYDCGIAAAGKALIRRFTKKADRSQIIPHSVNILGMTPLDYGNNGNDRALRSALEEAGWTVNGCLFMGTDPSQLECLAKAQVNLAVSAAGLEIAEYMKFYFGMPYAAAAPMGQAGFREMLKNLEYAVIESPHFVRVKSSGNETRRILLVMDQIMGNSLRHTLEQGICSKDNDSIDVASFFGWNTSLARKQDVPLKSEKDLLLLLRSGRYQTIAGDPMLADIPEVRRLHHIRLTHPAISGLLHPETLPEYLSDKFNDLLLRFCEAV
ncbi:MAG: nitrogenase component 1 [Lachnospiraceae bacterium]